MIIGLKLMEKEPMVHLEVTMTPEEYISIKKDASWQGESVAKWLVTKAMGRQRQGC